jgi:hypothetical protein
MEICRDCSEKLSHEVPVVGDHRLWLILGSAAFHLNTVSDLECHSNYGGRKNGADCSDLLRLHGYLYSAVSLSLTGWMSE